MTPATNISDAAQSQPVMVSVGGVRVRLLLVEDHAESLHAMARLLRDCDYDVATAETVRAAREITQRENFDLIICDIGLPDGSGDDLLRELLQSRPVRAIALSGFGMEDEIERAKSAGFLQYLTKPVDFANLQTVVETLTRKS